MNSISSSSQASKHLGKCLFSFQDNIMLKSWYLFSSVLLLMIALVPNNAFAMEPPIVVDDQFTERAIGLDLSILEDPTTQLTLEDVRSNEYSSQFRLSNNQTPSYGYTKSVYWSQFSINDQRSHDFSVKNNHLYLVLAFAVTDNAELWCNNASGKQTLSQRAGDHVPRSEWPTTYREPIFKLPSGSQLCWLRVQSSALLHLPLTLYSQEAYFNLRLRDNTLQALYFGALLVMLVYNASIAVSIRSLGYSAYTLFLLSYGLLQCSLSGFGYALLWVDAIGTADSVIPYFIACVGFSSALFAMVVLDLNKSSPRWFKYGLFVLFIFSFHLVLPWFISFSQSMQAITYFIPFWAIFLLGSGIYLTTKNSRIAKIYLAAWLVFIIGAVLAGSLSWIPTNEITLNAMQIGSVIEFIMLSFALSDRIKNTQKELLQAQQQITENLQKSEQQLEQKVIERTAELEEAQTALSRAERSASLNSMVSHLAHEVNNPLNYISTGEMITKESVNEAKSFILSAIPDSEESKPFVDKIKALFVEIDLGIQQSHKGTVRIRDTIQEIRAITGVDGIHVDNFDMVPILYSNWELTCEKNQISPGSVSLEVNGIVFPDQYSGSLKILSQKYIFSRAIRTLLNNSIYFAKKNQNPKIQIEMNSINSENQNIKSISIRNNGSAIDAGHESKLFDLKSSKYFGTELIGLPLVKEILKSVQCNITLTDNGRDSGWVEFQILMKDYV
jgi:signal transduction histidine kinase